MHIFRYKNPLRLNNIGSSTLFKFEHIKFTYIYFAYKVRFPKGKYVYNGIKYPKRFLPIIDEETFNEAKKLLDKINLKMANIKIVHFF